MRIKSLQISGFKSFVDKLVLEIRPGINGIVGPNGCGKSNVVDAVRWVMGEQSPRRLRGKGMEDVIFAGSEKRAPVGMAEVILTFDNHDGTAPAAYSEFSEIQLARRLFRSGESEYLINKVGCRLRDVQDFFRDAGIGIKGYTIVEQGRIAEIVSARPEERRILIEEAAGISKYKARRREAESKLNSTEQNLVRVSDVLGEIRRQISSLERQARKAARYKELREAARQLELSLAFDDRRSLLEEVDATRRQRITLEDAATESATLLAEREASLEAKRLDLADRERILNLGNEALFTLGGEIKEFESRIAYERRERAGLAESNVGREEELVQLRDQVETTQADLASFQGEAASLEASLATESEAVATAESEARTAEDALRSFETARERGSSDLVDVLTRIARTEDRIAALDDRKAEFDQRLRDADDALEVQQTEAAQVNDDQGNLEEGLRNLLGERDRLMGALSSALERHGRAVEQGRTLSKHLAATRERREVRRSRLTSLREVLERNEDVADGARFLLEEGGRRGFELRGLVRDVLDVDRDVETAVEAVLRDRAEALVVSNPQVALRAIETLRSEGGGRAVFVMERVEEAAPLGFVPLGEPLLGRVRGRPGYESLARTLLSGVNLVEDLAEVVRIYGAGRIPATFVTTSGDLLTPEGVVRGGGQGDQSGLLSRRREVRELADEVESLEEAVQVCESQHRDAEAELATAADELENLRNRHHTAALAVANHEKDLERTQERVKTIHEAQEVRVAERSSLLGESEGLLGDRTQLSTDLDEARQARSERQRDFDELSLKIGSAGRELQRRETVLTERRVIHSGRVEKHDSLELSIQRSGSTLMETQEWIARRQEEIREGEERRAALAVSIEEAQEALTGKLRDEEESRGSRESKRDAYERDAAAVRELEATERTLRTDLAEKREQTQKAELTLRETELRLEHLEQSVRDKWNLDLAQWTPQPVTRVTGEGGAEASESASSKRHEEMLSLPAEERRARLVGLQRSLEALGEVNLGAIEEHEELGERFRFLSDQKSDLESTIQQLREAISRINRTSRRRFRETFEAVRERFSQNFPRLFGGGKASLSLTESEDILEAGIDIMAQPPGKRLQNVNLLSGGEKTLTALALLTAVFQVRPSPFFFLDEVDAALDDANVGRFNDLVKELAKESQFLLITHNKRTIEAADLLYGVTMQEKGVSKLVSVELS